MCESSIQKEENFMKALILYKSYTGNTEKVTRTIEKVLRSEGIVPEIKKISKENDVELYAFDLVFLGTPVIELLPAKPVFEFIHSQLSIHRKRGDIVPSSPKISGKYAVCYCTYSGPHTGIREAIPAVKYMEQFFEHLRFSVLGEWYFVGGLKGNEVLSTKGALGDIKGRPTEEDLLEVERRVKNLIKKIEKLDGNHKRGGPTEFVPSSLRFISEDVEFYETFKKLSDIQKRTSSIDRGLQELIKVPLAASYRCRDCLKTHILEAMRNGITDIEIRDALLSGAIMGGPPFLSFSFEVLEELGLV